MSKGKHLSLLGKEQQKAAQGFFDDKDDYEKKLRGFQEAMLGVQRHIYTKKRKAVLVFEGNDAAGKGGAISRLTQYLDPRFVKVHSTGKPNAVEAGEHYMQRFFEHLPQPGQIAIFDRSWYGRVLVERVEKLCPHGAWERAYNEINAIEKMWNDDGILVLKYLLDISYDEQHERFKERKENPLKSWKLTIEDVRNRKKWSKYEKAFLEMLERTSTESAPWKVVPADSKWFARVAVIGDVVDQAKHFFKF